MLFHHSGFVLIGNERTYEGTLPKEYERTILVFSVFIKTNIFVRVGFLYIYIFFHSVFIADDAPLQSNQFFHVSNMNKFTMRVASKETEIDFVVR